MSRYDKMVYRRCGRSGLKLSALSLGLWHNFGQEDDPGKARELIWGAFDRGITHFDLANNYGPPPGSAEATFGKIMKESLGSHRYEIAVSTKAGHPMWEGPYGDWGSRKHLITSLDQSLERMGLDYVDVFYSHRYDPDTPLEETMGALDYAVRSGRALYAGLSKYPASVTSNALEILRNLGTPCLVYQGRYNMMDRELEGMLDHILEVAGVGLTVFSPLAQGLLTNRYLKGIPGDSRAARDGFLKRANVSEEMIRKTELLNALAQERGQSLASLALTWVLSHGGVTSAVIGASRMEQLEDNLTALDAPEITAEERERIDSILKNEK
ncbi:MAG: aldo/keto reductase [Spirochaetales bacterium]|nr:aldo/keto reductase [Spirochaetales bacterium]